MELYKRLLIVFVHFAVKLIMDQPNNHYMKIEQSVSLIIPAYNEARNIQRVLSVVSRIKWLDEIIVVNDASTDKTAQTVAKYPNIKLINREKNGGKGKALADGIRLASSQVLIFLDSDLTGLEEVHLLELLAPVLFTKSADLSLGVFSLKKISGTKIANRTFPRISGQRAIWKNKLPSLKKLEDEKYGVDIAITLAIPKKRIDVVVLQGLSQVTKEKKDQDIFKSLQSRYRMYRDILKSIKKSKEEF